jgi:hypothetical protein
LAQHKKIGASPVAFNSHAMIFHMQKRILKEWAFCQLAQQHIERILNLGITGKVRGGLVSYNM